MSVIVTSPDTKIHLSSLDKADIIPRVLRRTARYWSLIYSKLLCLDWYWLDEDGNHPLCSLPNVTYGATDGMSYFLNPAGLDDLVKESLEKVGDAVGYPAFFAVHEGGHAILNHGWRLAGLADHTQANIAGDLKVNEMIHDRNEEVVGTTPFPIPDWALLDLKLSSPLSTEQLYQKLKKNDQAQQNNMGQSQEPDRPDDAGNPASGGGSGDTTGEPDPAADGGDGGGDPAAGQAGQEGGQVDAGSPDAGSDVGGGAPVPSDGNPGDVDADSGGSAGDGQSPSGQAGQTNPTSGRPGDGSADTFQPKVEAQPGESQADANLRKQREVEADNEKLLMQSAVESRACGTSNEVGIRVAEERSAIPEQDWVAYAQQFIETKCREGWLGKFNPVLHQSTGLIGPGREGRKVGDIVLVVDSSGSICQGAWRRFLNLAQHTLDEVKPETMHLISCSTGVRDHQELEVGDDVPGRLRGGGGTSFKAAFKYVAEELDEDPLLLIYFTDGCCSDHKRMVEPPYPVLWLSYDRPRSHFPWGEFAEITVS